jgi:hypothetical protein
MKPEQPEQDEPLSPDPSLDGASNQIVDETLKLPEDLSSDEAVHLLGTAFLVNMLASFFILKEQLL